MPPANSLTKFPASLKVISMSNQKKTFFLFFALLIVVAAATTTALRSQGQDGSSRNERRVKPDETEWPLVEYDAPEPADLSKRVKRQARGRKYDKSRILGSSEVAGAAVNSESLILILPALPVAESDVIVSGKMTAAQAYLSNDKTNVYSEFTLSVDEVLKNDGGEPLAVGSSIEMEREGGRVKFPSGQVFWYAIERERMPRVGRRYVLFLKRGDSEQAFHLSTGYELRTGKVFPLDSHPKFNIYNEVDEITFLNKLRDVIVNPSQITPQ